MAAPKPLRLPVRRTLRLRPCAGGQAPASGRMVRLRLISGGRVSTLCLPAQDDLTYLVQPVGPEPLTIEAEGAQPVADGIAARLFAPALARLRHGFGRRAEETIRGAGFILRVTGPAAARRGYRTFVHLVAENGLAPDHPALFRHPHLVTGWARADILPARPARPADIAVVLHLYYEEVWPDFAALLGDIDVPFELIVTTVPGREALAEAIRRQFPGADIRVGDNRGRDVRPFLALLEEGRLDRYRAVLKLHGKRSADHGRAGGFGDLWRNRLLFDLAAAPGAFAAAAARFADEDDLGLLGPRVHRRPHEGDATADWGENRSTVEDLAARMGLPPAQARLDFFAGTMFWVRPAALAPLRALGLATAFPPEAGRRDGALEHAVERLFVLAVERAGYRVDDTDAATPPTGQMSG